MIKKFCYKLTNRNFSIAIVWINGGSNMDAKNKKGINNILSSLIMRECEGYNNLEISEYIHSHGAELNQEILEDGIFINLKSLNEHFNKLFPLIDLIIKKPMLSEKQFIYVKKSIINLIKKEKENPFSIVYEKWRKLVYLNHPYAFNSIGYEKDIKTISYDDILCEYEKFKVRDMYLISNNANINQESINNINNKPCKEKYNFSFLKLNSNSRYVCTYQSSNQIILMLGNQTCSQYSEDHISLKVLESYLSFGMTSILFKFFREKNGLTYDAGVFNPLRNQNSPFLIYLSVSNENALSAFRILSSIWEKLLTTLINENDILLAKEKLKSSFLISNQSLYEILQRKIQLISLNKINYSEKDYLKEIDKVNSKEILEITNKYFTKPYLSTLGDKKTCDEIHNDWLKNF